MHNSILASVILASSAVTVSEAVTASDWRVVLAHGVVTILVSIVGVVLKRFSAGKPRKIRGPSKEATGADGGATVAQSLPFEE